MGLLDEVQVRQAMDANFDLVLVKVDAEPISALGQERHAEKRSVRATPREFRETGNCPQYLHELRITVAKVILVFIYAERKGIIPLPDAVAGSSQPEVLPYPPVYGSDLLREVHFLRPLMVLYGF
jgi:hypothetical protein